ncbi:MAG: sugar phosphate isomerase/epimerase [Anaerolineales bacterium]|nr:sugar phosphate isomerase/epimerase [Anaerolineales bacterium]
MKLFRLGTTSYVLPAEIMPNVRFLAGKTEDIELILFELEEENQSNLPSEQEMEELRKLAQDQNLTYTVHLPLDLKLGSGGEERKRSVRRALRVLHHAEPLDPEGYVVHVEAENQEKSGQWLDFALASLHEIAESFGSLEKLCVENLQGFPEDFWDPLFEHAAVSRCIDIGHLWLDDKAVVPYLEKRLGQTRVIHLHGIGSRDHQSLRHMEPRQVREVLDYLINFGFKGVVTLEMFSREDVFESRDMVLEMLESE